MTKRKRTPGTLKNNLRETRGDGLTREAEWLMSSFEGAQREITFRVLRPTGGLDQQGKRVNVIVHAETLTSSASDEFVSSFAKKQVEQFREIEYTCALAKNFASSPSSSPRLKLFAIHVRDIDLDIACEPVILPGAATDTVEAFRAHLVNYFKELLSRNVTSLYLAMIGEVERRGWRFNDLGRGENAKERWRELCAQVHPFWQTEDMTERERDEFAGRSRDTIFKNLRTGRFKSNNFDRKRTRRPTSHKGADEITRVRKSTKTLKRPH